MSKADVGDFHTIFSSPTRCFSSRFMTRPKNRNRNRQKITVLTFLEDAPRGSGDPPRVPGGPLGHLSHENEAQGPRNRAIGVPTPNFGKKKLKTHPKKKGETVVFFITEGVSRSTMEVWLIGL